MGKLDPPLAIALAILVLTAAVCDIRARRIPNWLTVAGLIAGMMLQTGLHGWSGARAALFGFGLGLLVFLPPYLLRGTGGGDVKLMAAAGTMAGPVAIFSIFVLTAILGGLMALALVAWKGRLRRTLHNIGFIFLELVRGRAPYTRRPELTLDDPQAPKLPYAIPIAAGTLLYLLG